MKGKDKCEFLKGIRKRMAEANGIPYEPRECTYEGDCTGTCPFCEKEAADLMAILKKKEAEGAEINTDDVGILAIELGISNKKRDEPEKNTEFEMLQGSFVNSYDEDIDISDLPPIDPLNGSNNLIKSHGGQSPCEMVTLM